MAIVAPAWVLVIVVELTDLALPPWTPTIRSPQAIIWVIFLRELRAVHRELVSERPSSGKSDAEAG